MIATARQESMRRFIELSAQQLGWTPTTTLEEAKKEAYLKREGFAVAGARE